MIHKLLTTRYLACLSLCLLLGCSDDGTTRVIVVVGDYRGIWDVRYNLTVDDCFLVESGILGFVDVHEIEQQGASVTLVASSDSGVPLTGTVREDKSLATEQLLEGDIFGIGLPCQLYQAISYEPTETGTTTSLFIREIACDDGFFCETRGLGESKRR